MSTRTKRRPWLPLVASVACAFAFVGAASAQAGGRDRTWGEPPKVPPPDKNKISLPQFGIAAVIGGLIMVASLIPSKRGHQD